MKRKFRATNKVKIFSCLFVISLLSLSIVSFNAAFAIPDDLPDRAREQIRDKQSNGKPQFVSVSGKILETGIFVHIWMLIPEGGDKNEIVKQALARYGAQPFVTGERFVTTGVVWNQFNDGNPGTDFVTQNYNPSNEPLGGLDALLNSQASWTDVSSSSFAFEYGGTTNRCPSIAVECGDQKFDELNDVAWLPIQQENVLGVTYSVNEGNIYLVGGKIVQAKKTEADMIIDPIPPAGFSWVSDGINDIDMEAVFLHENGHALGLGHEEIKPAVMNPIYQGPLTNLLADDMDGVSSLYPAADLPDPPTLVIYENDMESGTNGWTATGSTGLWHQSTLRANTGTTSWYYGDETHNPPDYDTGGNNTGYLTSPVISLDGATSAVLEFYEWSSLENSPDWDRTRIQASSNGVHWYTVGEFHETFGVWEKREINLESWTGDDIRLRFWFDTIDDFNNNEEGWYVDDVKILVDNANTIPNDPPVANDDTGTVAEGGTITIDLAANDTDSDDGIDTTSIVLGTASIGSLVNNNDGTVDYTHDGSETTSDSFTYTIDDTLGATSNIATVDITVTPGNADPVTIEITSPQEGEISGRTAISATVFGSFDGGFVLFAIGDDVILVTSTPFETSIHTKDYSSGPLTISADAMVDTSSVASDSIEVTIPSKGGDSGGGNNGGGPDCTAKPNHPKCQ